MTISNHMLAGTLIAVVIKQPLLALPLAFASHFVLDSLPHFGYEQRGFGELFRHKITYVVQALSIVGLVLLAATGVYGWNLALLAGIIAVSPDLEWGYRYFFFERKGLTPPKTPLTDFHQKIQWCERSWGIFSEAILFSIGFVILLARLH